MIFENPSECTACELRSLIRVEDLWSCHLQRSSQRARTELAFHRRRDFPTENVSRIPVDDCDQVNKAGEQTNVGDVSAPDLIHPRDLHATQQIRIDLITRQGD